MVFTDRVYNYTVEKALSPDKIKTSREYYVLAVLKYLCPEVFSQLEKSETPDLQNRDGLLGVEVTWGGSPRDEIINGENYKLRYAKTEKQRERCLETIRKEGGNRDKYTISYPMSTGTDDKNNIEKIVKKKLNKIHIYKEKCSRVGLAILLDIPLFFLTDKNWESWLSNINNNGFNFIILLHWSGIDICFFETNEYRSIRFKDREENMMLHKIARMTTEGIIKESDLEWT